MSQNQPRTSACSSYLQTQMSRRQILKVGGLGMLGMTLPGLLRAEAVKKTLKSKAKSVIFLFQWGGPSHVDMFDRKPNAPEGVRGPLSAIKSSVPGLHLCEGLERLAKVMDKVTVVRSVYHTMKNHNSAGYYALTGRSPVVDDQRLRDSIELFPAYGSMVDALAPNHGEMPTSISYPYVISDGSVTPGQHASFLGKEHDPYLFTQDPNSSSFALPELSLPSNLTMDRLRDRRQLQQIIDKQSRLNEISATAKGLDSYYEKAFSMLDSTQLRDAFNIAAEPQKVRDSYGRSTYGQSCLLARRLVEAGAKFATVYFSSSIGGRSDTSGGWDTHGFDNTRMYPIIQKYHLPLTDQTLPTLLIDLEERGLLDSTLVVWMGEFGRTPFINKNVSRDHWPQCYSVLLAGGGIKRGHIYGASDKNGAYPSENPVRPDDIAATMYYLLGIDPHTEVHDASGRPLAITTGKPIMDIMA